MSGNFYPNFTVLPIRHVLIRKVYITNYREYYYFHSYESKFNIFL